VLEVHHNAILAFRTGAGLRANPSLRPSVDA
jgi:hypothetical protein